MKIELENVKNWREDKYRELDAVVFESNQKIKSCLSVREELLRLENEQKRLQDFLNKYNAQTIDDNQKLRELLAETTQSLQKQLTNHWRKIDAMRPRLEELEFQLHKNDEKTELVFKQLENHRARLEHLSVSKLEIKTDDKARE